MRRYLPGQAPLTREQADLAAGYSGELEVLVGVDGDLSGTQALGMIFQNGKLERVRDAGSSSQAVAGGARSRTVAQIIGNAAWTMLTLPTAVYDAGGCLDEGATSRVYTPMPGVWIVQAYCNWNPAPQYGHHEILVLYRNGQATDVEQRHYHNRLDIIPSLSVTMSAWMLQGDGNPDYYELYVYQDSGANQQVEKAGLALFRLSEMR